MTNRAELKDFNPRSSDDGLKDLLKELDETDNQDSTDEDSVLNDSYNTEVETKNKQKNKSSYVRLEAIVIEKGIIDTQKVLLLKNSLSVLSYQNHQYTIR